MLSPKQIESIKEQAFVGVPSPLENVCLITPPTIKEIVTMGTYKYNTILGLLLLTEVDIMQIIKEQTDKDVNIEDIKPLEYLLQSASYNDMFFLVLEEAFSTFIKEELILLPKINSVLVGPMTQRRLITESNFRDFQDILRIQNKKEIKEAPPENESEIARKFRLKREARDAIKRKQKEKNGEQQSLLDLFEIAETFGIDYKNKTIFAFYNLLTRHQRKEKWDQDIQMLCAGADSQKLKTKYWGVGSKDE